MWKIIVIITCQLALALLCVAFPRALWKLGYQYVIWLHDDKKMDGLEPTKAYLICARAAGLFLIILAIIIVWHTWS